MHISKELKVGILAITSLVILYMGFNYLKGIDFLSSTNKYYTLYDNVDGLTISNPVIINGLTVGRVNDIRILQQLDNKILVELDVDDNIEVSEGTVAKLVNLDFLGSKAIELALAQRGGQYYSSGDTLESMVPKGISDFLQESAGPVADDLGSTISNLNKILENFSSNGEKINGTLQNILEITEHLNKQLPGMETEAMDLMTNLNQNSEELSTVMAELKPILAKADQFTDSLSNLEINSGFKKLESNLENLNTSLQRLNNGEGTMGKIMTDDSLYIYLTHTARDLDRLLVDLRENPGRYVQFSVFGKKDKSDKKDKQQSEGQ